MAGVPHTSKLRRMKLPLPTFLPLVSFALVADASEPLRPTFLSEVAAPREKIILPLLKVVCGQGVRTKTAEGRQAFGCGGSMSDILSSRIRSRTYSWLPYVFWQAVGGENHPALRGGTLLPTKDRGGWKPVWYKPGVITRHCRRVFLSTGRQILFCEETDGGMGYSGSGCRQLRFGAKRRGPVEIHRPGRF